MTEYWISKKQYWCKYCSIWIRDDAPSRKQHETGLKHQGNKERYIRELYKTGNQNKREKEAEAVEIARIEASAAAAHALDTNTYAGRPASTSSSAASSSRIRDKPRDKWANYTSAKDLGFDDLDVNKSSYEIEQELKGRAAEPGAWETVEVVPTHSQTVQAEERKHLAANDDAEEAENFKFEHRDKRPARDAYDDDDWDPRTAFKSLKKRKPTEGEDEKAGETSASVQRSGQAGPGGWSNAVSAANRDYADVGGRVDWDRKPKLEPTETDGEESTHASNGNGLGRSADVEEATETKPVIEPAKPSLFKKRRPPPGMVKDR